MSYTFRGITLPDHLRESLNAYIEQGRPTGGFLQACIENDMKEAFGRADENNLLIIPAIVGYLYNEAPQGCWGYKGAFTAWLEKKRQERWKEPDNVL